MGIKQNRRRVVNPRILRLRLNSFNNIG